MKFFLTIFTATLFVLTLTSPTSIIDSSSILNNLSQLFYTNINPIFDKTFQQLIELTHEFNNKYIQIVNNQNQFSRNNPVKPAEWVSQLFNGSNSIQDQWNSHIADFFENIQTIYQNDERSLFDFSMIKIKLNLSIEKLLKKLKDLFEKRINQLIIPQQQHNKDLDKFKNNLQKEISHIFDNTKKEINHTINDLFDSVFNYWNSLKNRFFG